MKANLSPQKRIVVNYYQKTLIDYQLIYFNKRIQAMNYGYWDNTVRNRYEALNRLSEIVAQKLNITQKDFVLDAGCGLGATSFWLAKKIGCQIEGISISPNQIKIAQDMALKNGLSEKITFNTYDYTNTPYPNNSFNAILAIETICHLENKADFYREMYRILKPGGRLVVAEYVLKKTKIRNADKQKLGLMLEGWVIPNLWTLKQHQKTITEIGFDKIAFEDYSGKTTKVSRYLYFHSLYGLPIYYLLNRIGFLDKVRFKDAVACRHQWFAKKKGIWGHFLISAAKSKRS